MADWVLSGDGEKGYGLDNGVGGENHLRVPAIVGRAGLIAAAAKREGDMATPIGRWPLRHIYYRQDIVGRLPWPLPSSPITRQCGWCDDPASPAYNRHVTLPFNASCETMWRDDGAYDLVVMLGYNDAPPIAGHGSAIFLHCIAPEKTGTAGCVAVARDDLVRLLNGAGRDQHLVVPDLRAAGG
jgi:L,D-peptidoglycan transpeptidase YkuD (ErfK/YbiS/YcfS/YnhG family)